MAFGNMLDKFNEFELLDIPIGAAVYYKAVEQLSDFVIDIIDHFLPVPPIVSGLAASYLFRLHGVEDFLGKYGSYYASMAAAGSAIDSEFHISEAMQRLLGKVEGDLEHKSTPQISSSTKAPTSGYELSSGGVESLMQEPTTGTDADLYEEWMNQNKIQGM